MSSSLRTVSSSSSTVSAMLSFSVRTVLTSKSGTDLVFQFVESVFQLVSVRPARVLHIAELVITEPTHVVAVVVEAAEATEIVATTAEIVATATVVTHQAAAVGHPAATVVACVLALVVRSNRIEHILDAHTNQPAGQQNKEGGCQSSQFR